MKKIFILLTILFLTNCENSSEEKRSKNFENAYGAYMLINKYHWVNICPPASRIFEAGIHEISLEKGEALYYDLQARLNPNITNNSFNYLIGVSIGQSSTLSVNRLSPCFTNGVLSEPQPIKSASDISREIFSSDSDFAYYKFSLFKSLDTVLTIKATQSKTNFLLKIPEQGEK